ncbi:MAG: ammonium transporter [Alphaproteobacteria bacterium]
MLRKSLLIAAAGGAAALASLPAAAAVDPETAFVFNTFSFLVNGLVVMFMACGFAMLEAGLVRSKNTATICLKNIALYSIAGLMFYLIGYALMYTDVDGGFVGSLSFFYNPSDAELALINADEATAELVAAVTENGYASQSDWFFQMVFVATAASIVSGTVAERIKLWPFLIFSAILAAVIYPITGSWEWGGGWLNSEWYVNAFGSEFIDFAGSTLVHSCGGWAALAGAIVLGARKGKFGPNGAVHPMPGANLPLATLGTLILWFGWFGFNGGSQLALGSALDASAMAIVYTNTNLAAAAGCVAAMLATQLRFGKCDLTMALNGAIAGLVSITAGPDLQNHLLSVLVGGIGGVLVVFAVPLIDKLKIDDVVGAISAHLVAGIWGTLAVGIFGAGTIMGQLVGIVAVGAFVFVVSFIVWTVLKVTMGIRADEEDEVNGLDQAELGMEAYQEFGRGSQSI